MLSGLLINLCHSLHQASDNTHWVGTNLSCGRTLAELLSHSPARSSVVRLVNKLTLFLAFKHQITHSIFSTIPFYCFQWSTLSVYLSHLFSLLFFVMLSHIWMKVGSKLPYEELQIKFNFPQDWLTFSQVIVLCSKFVESGHLQFKKLMVQFSYFWLDYKSDSGLWIDDFLFIWHQHFA